MHKNDLQNLLLSTKELIDVNKRFLKESGEDFNIFSITNIEKKEVHTHSSMIAELLNPYGTHHQGNCFLFYFLSIIKDLVSEEHPIHTNLKSTPSVFVEYTIGPVSEDKLFGGRIDILLIFNDFKVIIENKVDADDQELQLTRYKNFCVENDIVLYLTKWNINEAVNKTAGDLKAGIDYHCISYQSEILEWLEYSLKDLKNQYVLDGVKQYYLLVRKITNQLTPKYMSEFKNLISSNLEEANYIKDNYDLAERHVRESFRDDLLLNLQTKLSDADYTCEIWGDINYEESGIVVKPQIKNHIQEATVYYYIAPFNNFEGILSISICNSTLQEAVALKLNSEWSKLGKGYSVQYPVFQSLQIDLSNFKQLVELTKPKIRKKKEEIIIEEVLRFIERNKENLEQRNQEYTK
ncbi:PD-(D/E)XK nuclease family protein [Leeuwenhoekiella sp. ZYFB001]|uniref:PDDEXK-like family protein n=1 Tax=Leeuwenhoekiella sp. ZYFB001 TaxID=2719912 RepID=UPI00142FEEB8|nr:PD-(D/E)XK nuclease family protein [Leeuwenhoekiella sp. ZYFB001]